MLRPNRLTWLLLALLACHGSAFALASDKDQPIELSADSVDVDQGKGQSTYKGDVDMRQGSMRLQAEQVVVRNQGNKPNRVIATGKVRFQQQTEDGLVKARAKKADYVVNSELLELTGDASLTQRGDTMHSDRIVYDRVKHKVKAGAAASGSQRVKITIQPKQTQ
jgi:lipopolysaccharide export system protein LptA